MVQDRWRHVGRDIDIIRVVLSCGDVADEQKLGLNWRLPFLTMG